MNNNCYARQAPVACRGCKKLWSDNHDEYSPVFYYCENNLMLPKKPECKLRRKIEHTEEQ